MSDRAAAGEREKDVVLGIDLGTTYSCVAYWNWSKNAVEVIPNDHGNRTTPSYVSFCANGDVIVGDAAKQRQAAHVTSTIYNAKRVIGRTFVQLRPEDIGAWPFDTVRAPDGKARFSITFPPSAAATGGGAGAAGAASAEPPPPVLVSPEQVSAHVLAYLKACAQRHLGRNVTRAVVTVPAYFTEPQKLATKDAAALAGLEVLKLVTEPTAAALAYGLDASAMSAEKKDRCRTDGLHVLVVDLGGGTFDVSVLKLDGRGSFVTRAVAGDFHLGGEDLDARLLGYVVQQITDAHPDLVLSKRSLRRLRTECQSVKHTLSSAAEATLDVELQGVDVFTPISRTLFESLIDDLLTAVVAEVATALELAGIAPADIDDVVLVGGSTRIPAVQQRLRDFFGGERELWVGINPDEAVAFGAAIQGAALVAASSGDGPRELQNLVLTNVTPLTLGVELSSGAMDVLIHRATRIPCSRSDHYTTAQDNQGSVIVKVYEGESVEAAANSLLGKFSLPVQRAPTGVPKVEVTFSISSDGLLTVTARDLSTDIQQTLEIERSSNLSQKEKAALGVVGSGSGSGAAASGAGSMGVRIGQGMGPMQAHLPPGGGGGDGGGGGSRRGGDGGGGMLASLGSVDGSGGGGGDSVMRRMFSSKSSASPLHSTSSPASSSAAPSGRKQAASSRGGGAVSGGGSGSGAGGSSSRSSEASTGSASAADAAARVAAEQARSALTAYLFTCQRQLLQKGIVLSDGDRSAVMEAADAVMRWLDEHTGAMPEELAMQQCMFDLKWKPIARRMSG